MADTKISDLTSAGTLTGAEVVPVVQSGANRKLALSALLSWITAALSTALRLIPAGGGTGQYLRKTSIDDYETEWSSAGLVPDSSVAGYVLTQQSGTAGDYAFAPPPVTPPAGSAGQIQYHDGGAPPAFAGASKLEVAASGSLKALEDTDTTAAPADSVIFRGEHLAGLTFPGAIDEEGRSAALQWSLAQRRPAQMVPPGAGAAPSVVGMAAWSLTGTGGGSVTTFASTLFASLREYAQASAATAGASCGYRHAVVSYGLGTAARMGGFLVSFVFGISDAASVADARMFIGMIGSASVIGNVNPSTLTNIIGVGCDNGGAQLVILHNDGSGTATTVATSASFPANTRSTDLYRFTLFAPPNATWVGYTLENITSGAVVSGKITTDLPAGTVALAPQAWRNNGATAAAVRLSLGAFYSETLF